MPYFYQMTTKRYWRVMMESTNQVALCQVPDRNYWASYFLSVGSVNFKSGGEHRDV